MKSSDAQSLAVLRTLLHEAAAAPATTVRALAAERTRLAGGGALAQELLAAELRWLERGKAGLDGEFAAARADWLRARTRLLLEASPDAAVLCDLAEIEATAELAGDVAVAAQCRAAIAAGATRVGGGPVVEQEVAERFALLTSAVDDLGIAHQVRLLACTGRAVQAIAAANGSTTCRRLGRRLSRAADDRELARRLEARVGRRGVAWIETTNFVLLLVVLAALVVEWTVDLSPGQSHALHWIDAAACLFFVADFAFELWLHPSRGSWFVRNALTDLLPAVPSVLFLVPGFEVSDAADGVLALRLVRLFRVTWAARYVQSLRPLLRSARLLLFLVRGLDGLVARFAQLLNREFVFVPAAAEVRRGVAEEDRRDLLFASLRREHDLVELLPTAARGEALRERLAAVRSATAAMVAEGALPKELGNGARDIPIGDAIEFLWSLRPQDVGRWLRPGDVHALDRVIRVLSALPVRWLPIVRRLAVCPLPTTAEERIVAFGRRIAEWLESWHGRMLFFADLHGIVTGPQILDRVATALVKATQRPAVRLILFGGVLSLFGGGKVSDAMVILGAICLGLVSLGYWLKKLAGQASSSYRLTSEAHFLSQVERDKLRFEVVDTAFLAQRVFGAERATVAQRVLQRQLASVRTGVPGSHADAPDWLCREVGQVALLYQHFLDGAALHEGDVKTTEQLLASQSLQNLRERLLHVDKKAKKRLHRLRLDQGSILGGPYLWFSFITESIAVEAAKRIAGYNRWCIPLAELATARPEERAAMHDWLQRRRDPRGGRTLAQKLDQVSGRYPAAEFTALDFVGGDPERDRHLAAIFGDEVLDVVRADRRTMVREIFGTRPVHDLPKHERSFNPLRFHQRRLSHGRVLLLPLLFLWRFLRSLVWLVAKVRQIVREVFDPELAMQRRSIGEAPFAVALRKIHRMKAPGLLEAIRLRLAVDPEYSGAPTGWTSGATFAAEAPVERDLRFLHLHEREAARLRDQAATVRAQVQELHAARAWLPEIDTGDPTGEARAAGELAVTCAWLADQDGVRTLLFAERWRTDSLPTFVRRGLRPGLAARAVRWLRGLVGPDTVERWLERHGHGLDAGTRAAVQEAWRRDLCSTRSVLSAWAALPAGASPAEAAIAVLRRAFHDGRAVRRDLVALRAVQSLAVLDIRNYRDLVFRLGDYASDGEDPRVGEELP
ncbi:MAG: hypothetical protein JNK15_09630 [Planctomycetes bacterium]|nr:hypothetical protein [Planctomycetota bacterium]